MVDAGNGVVGFILAKSTRQTRCWKNVVHVVTFIVIDFTHSVRPPSLFRQRIIVQ